MAFLIRLFALAALILMPFGMGTAPAAAAAPASHAANQQQGHCGGQADADVDDAAAMPCGGLCSALPAEPAPLAVAARAPVARAGVVRVGALDGVMPHLSTPPPRLG